MIATIAWVAPLTWGAVAFAAVLLLTRHLPTSIEKQSAPPRALRKAA